MVCRRVAVDIELGVLEEDHDLRTDVEVDAGLGDCHQDTRDRKEDGRNRDDRTFHYRKGCEEQPEVCSDHDRTIRNDRFLLHRSVACRVTKVCTSHLVAPALVDSSSSCSVQSPVERTWVVGICLVRSSRAVRNPVDPSGMVCTRRHEVDTSSDG